MKRVIVTGGAGFLGSNLCAYLLEKGDYVICVDDFSSGIKKTVEDLKDHENFEMLTHNVIEPLEIEGKIDQIYHLASRASPPNYQDAPIHTMLTNAVGTNNLLKLAMEKDAVFLFSSTSEVYGSPEQHPQKETYWGNVNPVGIRSCYDESKRFGEALIMSYYRKHNSKVKIIRIFNTYGPRMRIDDGRVVTNFVSQALKGEDITIYGDGKQTRSFCFVRDMVKGIHLMMNSGNEFIGPVNLGNPSEITMIELAETIKKVTNSNSKLIYMDLPKDDPPKRKASIELAKAKLGWEPEINLESGLAKTIVYVKKELGM